MIPWLSRMPTAEEIAAHAAAHPVKQWFSDVPHAYWLRYPPPDSEARWGPYLTLLGAADGNVYWQGDAVDYGGNFDSLFLPATAQGLPVDYVAMKERA